MDRLRQSLAEWGLAVAEQQADDFVARVGS
jgi:hypothetical protein